MSLGDYRNLNYSNRRYWIYRQQNILDKWNKQKKRQQQKKMNKENSSIDTKTGWYWDSFWWSDWISCDAFFFSRDLMTQFYQIKFMNNIVRFDGKFAYCLNYHIVNWSYFSRLRQRISMELAVFGYFLHYKPFGFTLLHVSNTFLPMNFASFYCYF